MVEEANRVLRSEIVEHKITEKALAKSREELREIAAISSTAREQEKQRIARELHDELAQTLTMLTMDLYGLEPQLPKGNAILTNKIAEMQKMIDGAVAATRRIASDLRPLLLDDLGLISATQWLVQNFQQRSGIRCDLVVEPPQFDLEDPYATAAFRIMQEGLANIARHAHASHAQISLIRHEGNIRLRIRDDGRGFDPAAPRKANSFGLVGLRERASLVEGTICIDTAPDKVRQSKSAFRCAPGLTCGMWRKVTKAGYGW